MPGAPTHPLILGSPSPWDRPLAPVLPQSPKDPCLQLADPSNCPFPLFPAARTHPEDCLSLADTRPEKADMAHPCGYRLGNRSLFSEPHSCVAQPLSSLCPSPLSSPVGVTSPARRSGSVTTPRPTLLREWGSHTIRKSRGQMWRLGKGSGKAVPHLILAQRPKGCGCRKHGRERLARGVQAWLPGHNGNGTWLEGWPGDTFPSHGAACLHSVCSHRLFQTAGPTSSRTVPVNTLSVAGFSHRGTLLSAMALSQPRNGESPRGNQRA